MPALASWIKPHPRGIYVEPGDFWIDPSAAVPRALITHGHADHARSGHGAVMATAETLAIMAVRYGAAERGEAAKYGAAVNVGGVSVTFVPAGHVLGSAQIVMEYKGERVVVSGDYKRQADPTCPAFEPVPCDVFITEATFGLPVFRHPAAEDEIGKVVAAAAANPDRCVLVGAYALGKAQRVIGLLRAAGYDAPIYIHGALETLCELYGEHGVELGDLKLVAGVAKEELAGQIVVAPPGALNDSWSQRLPDPITAMASGWMRIRQRARQSGAELPLIISDHADWTQLTETVREVNPREVWITHGREDALMRWCEVHQVKARALALVGREGEDG